jgi:hypothetical protein
MKWTDLLNKHVAFTDGLKELDLETFEPNMRAVVVDVIEDTDCVEVVFDFSKYEEYNKNFMTPNFFDGNGRACLKWCEMKYYPENLRDEVYFDDKVSPLQFVTVLEEFDTLASQLELLIPMAEKLNLDKVVPILKSMKNREQTINNIGN